MRKLKCHIFSLLLLCSVNVFGQDTPPKEILDTVITITEVPPIEDKDTFTFDSIGAAVMVPVRNVSKKQVDSLKAEEDFWYANAVPEKKKQQAQEKQRGGISFFQQQWFHDLLWVIILCSFIAVVLWYLVSSNILLFRKEAKKILNEEEEKGHTDDIFALNYDREISKAEETSNFRLAVRLRYLRVLKELADRQLIDYHYGQTNNDYVTQLYKSQYYRDFFRLTRNFEYTWYGQFNLSAEAYAMMRQDFSTFQNGLRG